MAGQVEPVGSNVSQLCPANAGDVASKSKGSGEGVCPAVVCAHVVATIDGSLCHSTLL